MLLFSKAKVQQVVSGSGWNRLLSRCCKTFQVPIDRCIGSVFVIDFSESPLLSVSPERIMTGQ